MVFGSVVVVVRSGQAGSTLKIVVFTDEAGCVYVTDEYKDYLTSMILDLINQKEGVAVSEVGKASRGAGQGGRDEPSHSGT